MSVLSAATLTQQAQHSRRAVMSTDGQVLTQAVDTTPFACFRTPPKSTSISTVDGSPRTIEPSSVLWWKPPVELHATDRVVLFEDGGEWELLSEPRAMRAGPTTYGWQADVLPLGLIYPRVGRLERLGGQQESDPLIPCSVWRTSTADRRTGRGAYEDMSGEAPSDYFEQLRTPNARLRIGDSLYRITAATMNSKLLHVDLVLNLPEYD